MRAEYNVEVHLGNQDLLTAVHHEVATLHAWNFLLNGT